MIDENTLRRGCEALGIILTDEQVRQFLTYYEFLVEKEPGHESDRDYRVRRGCAEAFCRQSFDCEGL